MLTLLEYEMKFPEAFHWDSWKLGREPEDRFITEGMLLFTEKSAHLWGGPFKGNYAQFTIVDHTGASFLLGETESDEGRPSILGKTESDEGWPSRERPVSFHICGNDDMSYSKFYATEQEALDELALLCANEPLDFHEVWDLGFVFTN